MQGCCTSSAASGVSGVCFWLETCLHVAGNMCRHTCLSVHPPLQSGRVCTASALPHSRQPATYVRMHAWVRNQSVTRGTMQDGMGWPYMRACIWACSAAVSMHGRGSPSVTDVQHTKCAAQECCRGVKSAHRCVDSSSSGLCHGAVKGLDHIPLNQPSPHFAYPSARFLPKLLMTA